MATREELCIAHPSQLHDLDYAITLSNLDRADSSFDAGEKEKTQPAPSRLRLALLQPLADSAMLSACRNSSSSSPTRRRANDWDKATDLIYPEYINISALDKAWRHALANTPPVSDIVFDLSLPEPVDARGVPQHVDWATRAPLVVPREAPTPAVFAISSRKMMRLVVGLATVTRMRVSGEVDFEVRWDEAPGGPPAKEMLEGQLKKIAEVKCPLKTGIVEPLQMGTVELVKTERPRLLFGRIWHWLCRQ